MNVDSLFANLSPTGLGSGISSGLGGPSSVDSSSLLNAAALGGRGSGGGAGGSGLGGGGLDGLDLGRGNSSLGGLGGLGGSLGLGSSTLGGGSSLGGSSLSGLGGTGLGASGVTGLGSGSLSRDDRSTSFSRSRLGNHMQSEPGADEGSADGKQSAPKASGKSAVPDYHKQAVEEDFFAGVVSSAEGVAAACRGWDPTTGTIFSSMKMKEAWTGSLRIATNESLKVKERMDDYNKKS